MAAFEQAVKALVEMGFDEERSRAALREVDPPTADAALEFLVANEDGPQGAAKAQASAGAAATGDSAAGSATELSPGDGSDGAAAGPQGSSGAGNPPAVVQSYRCVETGKLFRTMQDAQLYAERTGRSNFEESSEPVPVLTAEEKQEKIAQIRELLKKKRAEREENEKAEEYKREIERRKGGQKLAELRESHERMQREAEIAARKKEKEAFKRERERLKRELAKDKAERAADAARRRGASPEEVKRAADEALRKALGEPTKDGEEAQSVGAGDMSAKVDQAITDLKAYRAGGDGERALKTLRKMISNVVGNPAEPKFKQVNLDNDAFKKRVGGFVGGVAFLRACGFKKDEVERVLRLEDDALDTNWLADVVARVDKALAEA